jgi:hypothetical protein
VMTANDLTGIRLRPLSQLTGRGATGEVRPRR